MRYDRAIDDIFALQDEITLSTVAAIEPSLRQAEIERAKRKRPEHLGAYDLVLRATPLVDALMPGEASQAILLLEQALALEDRDPGVDANEEARPERQDHQEPEGMKKTGVNRCATVKRRYRWVRMTP